VQQKRAEVDEKLQKYQDNMKALFDKRLNIRSSFLMTSFLNGILGKRMPTNMENLITSVVDLSGSYLLKERICSCWKTSMGKFLMPPSTGIT
jgi:hypothetical protein